MSEINMDYWGPIFAETSRGSLAAQERIVQDTFFGMDPHDRAYIRILELDVVCSERDRQVMRGLGFIYPGDHEHWQVEINGLGHFFPLPIDTAVNPGDSWPGVGISNRPSLARSLHQHFTPLKRMGGLPIFLGSDELGVQKEGLPQLFFDPSNPRFNGGVTRLDHSAIVGYTAAAVTSRWFRTYPDNLRMYLPTEYASLDDEQIAGISLTAGFLHDLHPAGGDATKIATGVSERDVFSLLGDDDSTRQRFELICARHNLGDSDRLWDLCEAVVNRRDQSAVGQLVHQPECKKRKRRADLDFWAYTVSDAYSIPGSCVDRTLPPEYFEDYLAGLSAKLSGHGEINDRIIQFPLSLLNVVPSLHFVDGQLAVTDPEAYVRLMRLSRMLFSNHYYHPDMIGPELVMRDEFAANRNAYPPNEQLMTMRNEELLGVLADSLTGDYINQHPHWERTGPLTQAEAVEAERAGARVAQLPVNLRSSTLVWDGDTRIITATDYMKGHHPDVAREILETEKLHKQAWWAFRPI